MSNRPPIPDAAHRFASTRGANPRVPHHSTPADQVISIRGPSNASTKACSINTVVSTHADGALPPAYATASIRGASPNAWSIYPVPSYPVPAHPVLSIRGN